MQLRTRNDFPILKHCECANFACELSSSVKIDCELGIWFLILLGVRILRHSLQPLDSCLDVKLGEGNRTKWAGVEGCYGWS